MTADIVPLRDRQQMRFAHAFECIMPKACCPHDMPKACCPHDMPKACCPHDMPKACCPHDSCEARVYAAVHPGHARLCLMCQEVGAEMSRWLSNRLAEG
jgi:hypothetical protein